MTDPPSWHELKTRALEADFAAIEKFVNDRGGFPVGSGSQRSRDPPTFDDWFRFRFPENNLSSAPSAHKALWAEHERQLRWRGEESTKAGAEDFVAPGLGHVGVQHHFTLFECLERSRTPSTRRNVSNLRETSTSR